MVFGISLSDIAIFGAVVFFYVGFAIMGIIWGVYTGEITSKAEMFTRLSPIESLDTYNAWFRDSYVQMKDSADSVAIRNAYFGMFISGFAIVILWLLFWAIWKLPFGDTPEAKAIAILGSFLTFFLLGGFNGIGPVLGDMTGVLPILTNSTVVIS
jgi:hypothetical protein